jgi:hypothetical protein
VHSKNRSDHSLSRGIGSLEDNWGASKSLVISKGLLLKSPAIALQSNKASLRCNSGKLTLTKCTHTIRRLPQEFTHPKKLFQTQPRSSVNEAKPKPFGSSSSKLSDLSVTHQPVRTTRGNKQTKFLPNHSQKRIRLWHSKLNPQFSQTPTVTAIDSREANKQQLQQYSQGRNEGRKEGSRDRA